MSVVIWEQEECNSKKRAKRALEKLRTDFEDGIIISKELRQVMRKIRDDAKVICPKDTGTLASTIRLAEIPMGAMTGVWSHMKTLTIFNMSIVAGDLSKINPKTKKPCDYATWVHDGHKMRDGSLWGGVPFLTEAIAMNEVELTKAIDRALKKLGKKYEKDKCIG